MPNTPAATADTPAARGPSLTDRVTRDVAAARELDVASSFQTGGWKFTREVVTVFDGHVRASVPFYDDIQALVAELADWLVPAGGLVADLGCSTGNTSAAILARHPDREIRVVLYDEALHMVHEAQQRLGEAAPGRVDYHIGRLQDGLQHADADLSLLLFVLQFIPYPADRAAVLEHAHRAAAPTGALIVAEKTRPRDARWAEIAAEVSHDVKARAGISGEQIRAKAAALRGVLHPYPQDETIALIEAAGWHQPEVLFRWHQWTLIGAWAAR